jgi:hypothetical protein
MLTLRGKARRIVANFAKLPDLVSAQITVAIGG